MVYVGIRVEYEVRYIGKLEKCAMFSTKKQNARHILEPFLSWKYIFKYNLRTRYAAILCWIKYLAARVISWISMELSNISAT